MPETPFSQPGEDITGVRGCGWIFMVDTPLWVRMQGSSDGFYRWWKLQDVIHQLPSG
jgi:hypothetical protein